jgi:hypothetical protein
LANWQKGGKLQCLFEETINDIQGKKPLGTSIQTLGKANFTKNFGLDPKNQLTRPISFAISTRFISATRYTKPTNFFQIWKISSNND